MKETKQKEDFIIDSSTSLFIYVSSQRKFILNSINYSLVDRRGFILH